VSSSVNCSRTIEGPVTRIAQGVALAVVMMTGSCSRTPSGDSVAGANGQGMAPSLGEVMVQVGRRFEVAGRAAAAGRFELANFEIGELEELFQNDVPRASFPKEGPTAHIRSVADAFLRSAPPELKKAAAASDPAAFAQAFQRAAAMCNACHQASAKAFIQVPFVPGRSVPELDPLPSPSARLP
jgi:cytochrome c553